MFVETISSDSSGDEWDVNAIPARVRPRRSQLRVQVCGLSAFEIRRMKKIGLPRLVFQIFAFLAVLDGAVGWAFDVVEWMGGVGRFKIAAEEQHLHARVYEIKNDPVHEAFRAH